MPASDMLDDFEDGDGAIIMSGGRQGFWYTFNDGTAGGSQTPPSTAVVPDSGGACESANALHTTGSGFATWGAGIGVDLNNLGGAMGVKMPWDASAYTGIVIAARGSGMVRRAEELAAEHDDREHEDEKGCDFGVHDCLLAILSLD